MSKNTTVSLTLQLRGNAGQQLKQLNFEQIKSTQTINRNWVLIGQAAARAAQAAQKKKKETVDTTRASDQLLRTNRLLTQVLTQQQQQTRVMTQQLRQQERSYQIQLNTLRQQVREGERLRQTLQQAGREQQNLQRGGNLLGGATAVVGGTVAGGMVVSNALQKPRDYQQQMTYITATATAGQGLTLDQRRAKGNTLHQYVKDAVRVGGSARDDVAAALNELIASGKYNADDVYPALLSASKTAYASGAETIDAAKMTIALKTFGVNDLDLAQDRAVRAGQIGSFEYRDLAKWLPSQMALAKSFGYSGDDGLVELLSLNQIAKSTAPDSTTAGNNVVNLLQKLASRELSDTLADKVDNLTGLPTREVKNAKGKVVGQEFDWGTYALQQREQGVYGVEAFVKILERQLGKDERYIALQNKIKNTSDATERQALLSDMSNIMVGSELGQFIADRQALMAAIAVVYEKDRNIELKEDITTKGKGTVDADLALVNSFEWAKDQALTQEKLFAQSGMYDAVSEQLGQFKDTLTNVARGNEDLATLAYASTIALTALVAAAGVATVALNTLGKRSPTDQVPPNPNGGNKNTRQKITTGAGALLLAPAAYDIGYNIGTGLNEKYIDGTKAGDWIGEKAVQIMAKLGNDEAQAALEAQAQYEKMIAQQEQANKFSADLSNKLSTLITVTEQNRPLPPTPISISGLLGDIERHTATEEKRHGAFIPWKIQ